MNNSDVLFPAPREVDRELYADKTFPAGNIRMFPSPIEVDRYLYRVLENVTQKQISFRPLAR